MIAVSNEAQMRSCHPINTRRPRAISANGKVWATNWTPQVGSNLKASTCRAKLARLVEMENFRKNRGQRVWLGRKAFFFFQAEDGIRGGHRRRRPHRAQ